MQQFQSCHKFKNQENNDIVNFYAVSLIEIWKKSLETVMLLVEVLLPISCNKLLNSIIPMFTQSLIENQKNIKVMVMKTKQKNQHNSPLSYGG